jgi:Phage T7 capsid assembly protein
MTTPASTSNATPVEAPAGHDEAMVAKFEAAQGGKPNEQPNPAQAERPAGLPEKFASWEDMAKAYSELERKQSGAKPEAATPEAAAAASADEAKTQVEAAGLNFDEMSAEYQSGGELSQATYDKLAKAGIPKEAVDAYIAGQEAIAQRGIDSVMGEFGGAESYGKMVQWAATNLPKSDIAAFNKVMDSGDMGSIKLTIAGLQSKYVAANGSEPNLINGGNSDGQADVFRSTAEMTAAMSDPRYAKDPAYRADVQAKAGRSNIF